MSRYYVYILRCNDGSLYTGSTPDLAKRLKKHREGTGAKYTRGRSPLHLVYCTSFATKSEALREEMAIKKLSRKEKLKRIEEG